MSISLETRRFKISNLIPFNKQSYTDIITIVGYYKKLLFSEDMTGAGGV